MKEKEASVEVKAKENAKPEADKVVDPEVEKEKEAKKLREQAEAEKPSGASNLTVDQASNQSEGQPTSSDRD